MKFVTTCAMALAAAGLAAPAAAQTAAPAAAAPAKINISKKAAKAFTELQKAVEANDVATIPAKLAAARAVASTVEDRYAIGQMQLKAALAANDPAASVAALDAITASGYLGNDRLAVLYNSLGSKFYNAKDYARAAAQFERASTLDPRSPESYKLLGEARNAAGQKAEAAAAISKAIQLSAAAGEKPAELLYKRAVGMAYEAKLPSAVDLSRQWAAAYPNPDSWRNAIGIYRNMMRPNVAMTLDMLRLMRATGAMTTSGEYTLYASAASEQNNFAEAQAVIDEGLAAKKVSASDSIARDVIAALKTKPKPTAAELNASAKTAPTGATLVKIGDRFFGLGDYARAAELYRAAIAKGGADANLVQLHLGMALARAGDKAGAAAALNAVSGPNAEIAKYWLIYANRAG